MTATRKTIAVRLDPADDRRLRALAKAHGATISAIARELLSRGLAKLEAADPVPTDLAARPDPEALPARRSFSQRDLEVLTIALLARAELEAGNAAPLVSDLRREAEARYGSAIAWGLRDALRRLEAAGWVELLEDREATTAERYAGVQVAGRTYPRARLASGERPQ